MKKALIWIVSIIGIPALLLTLVAILLYMPPVQQWLVQQTTRYASKKLGLEVSIDKVRLAFPLDLSMENVLIIRPNDSLPQMKDTIGFVQRMVADVQLLPLLKKKVEIDELKFEGLHLNSSDFIAAAHVRGTIGQLALVSHGIDISGSVVNVDKLALEDAKLVVTLPDTVPEDTSQSKSIWKINVDDLQVRHTDVTVHFPGDTLQVRTYLGKAKVSKGFFDLGEGNYQVGQFDWTDGELNYDNKWKGRTKGIDYNHLALSNIEVGIDALQYHASKLKLNVRQMAFKERSGFDLQKLSGALALDSTKLYMRQVKMRTSSSNLLADADMDLNSFASQNPGKLNLTLHASLGKNDLIRFMGSIPVDVRKQWPRSPLVIDGKVQGNLQRMNFHDLRVNLPTALKAKATGYVANLNDIDHLKADAMLNVSTGKLDFVKAFMSPATRKRVSIPQNIDFKGHVAVNGQQYTSTFKAQQGGGVLNANVQLDASKQSYQAKLNASRLPLQHFLPNQGLHPFSGKIDLKGHGFDFLSPKTKLIAKAQIDKFSYDKYQLDATTADVTVKNGHAKGLIHSNNSFMRGDVKFDALTSSRHVQANLQTDLRHLDLHRLMDDSLVVGLKSKLNISTDFNNNYRIVGDIDDLTILDNGRRYHAEPINLNVLTRRDTTDVNFETGDFQLMLQSGYGYQRLLSHSNGFMKEVQRQLKENLIDEPKLRAHLPNANFHLHTGNKNVLVNFMRKYGIELNQASVDFFSSPHEGLDGRLLIEKLLIDSIQLDTVNLTLNSNEEGTTYAARIENNAFNPQYVFKAIAQGNLSEKGTSLRTKLFDEQGRLGIALGLSAELESNGIRTHLDSTKQVIGYKDFDVNQDNYLFIGKNKRISAQMSLRSKDGTGVQILSNDDHADVLQDVTFSVHKVTLQNILSAIPYVPNIAGTLNGDFHVIQTKDQLSISSSVGVQDMYYEKSPMGNLSSEFVYMPKSDGSHFIDGVLYSEGQEVAMVSGTYGKKDRLDAKLTLERLPLQLVNGFIPDRIIGLRGYADGDIMLTGTASKPDIDGEVFLDSSYIFSEPYGIEMRFANDPVKIAHSQLKFENFELFANNNSPLNIYGTFDFSNLDRMMLNIRMRAQNFEIIDARENPRSEAYGKAFVDFLGTMRGPVDNLRMRGVLNVLGTTDMTYVLRDSELSTDNQLDELVKFTNFKDSVVEVVQRPKLRGFDMSLATTIDEAAHIVCMLNADHTNYIDLQGGGELRMNYNPVDNFQLTGRYTLNTGEMKYSLPVIPLKTFDIQNGSYIEFSGDPMNPKLHITATEDIKATVNAGTGAGRVVDFDCGVKLSQNLDNPGIEFIINAPNDVTIQDELNTMTVEGRGKVAITMLVSGMYLTDGNMASFSMNNALSSYLESQINDIAGSAMRSMGLDLGMSIDNSTTATGGIHTDYNFRFSKRLWNNRLRVIVGGKVSSGEEIMADRDEYFFDNVELEYRLNQNASQYLRLFYNNNTYDWLEGLIGEYGVGFTWRRKLAHFKDIFRFKSDKKVFDPIQPQKKDSIPNEIQKMQ